MAKGTTQIQRYAKVGVPNKRICLGCGHIIPSLERTCRFCGASMQEEDRPHLCAFCQKPVDLRDAKCKNCGETTRPPCQSCSRPVSIAWRICPYCGQFLAPVNAPIESNNATPLPTRAGSLRTILVFTLAMVLMLGVGYIAAITMAGHIEGVPTWALTIRDAIHDATR